MKKPDEETDKLSRVVSVRVPAWVFQAFEQIQVIYNVKQSELIRMTPLLFLLLAEKNLSERQKELDDWEKKLKKSGPFDWDWAEIRGIDQERVAVNNNEVLGKKFLETLREMAAKNVHNKDAIKDPDKDIKLEEGDVVPRYVIFRDQTLRQIATEIASIVPEREIEGICNQEENRFDPQLLAAAGKKLGYLDAEQKKILREEFKNALKTRLRFDIKNRDDETASVDDLLGEAAYEVARNMVRPRDVPNILEQVREGGVPHRYDSWLLTKARKKLGRPLREAEKSRIREKFGEITLQMN